MEYNHSVVTRDTVRRERTRARACRGTTERQRKGGKGKGSEVGSEEGVSNERVRVRGT